jgi:hypothetical protein
VFLLECYLSKVAEPSVGSTLGHAFAKFNGFRIRMYGSFYIYCHALGF